MKLKAVTAGQSFTLQPTARTSVSSPLGESFRLYCYSYKSLFNETNNHEIFRSYLHRGIPTATYTAGQQVADFGSAQSSITFRVAQISSIVGVGSYAQATF